MKSLKRTSSQRVASCAGRTSLIRALQYAAGVCALVLVSACGGVDEGNIGNANEITLLAGTQTVVPGTIDTTQNLLRTISWKVRQITPNSPALVLENADCAVAGKTDRIYPASSLATETTVHGGSTWQCALTVTSVTRTGLENSYELLLTGTDELGRNITYSKTLRVVPTL